jgi:uncharacterized protein with PhoU and TrkA domain
MSEIDLVKYGVLWQKVEGYEEKFDHLEKKMDRMESQLDKLVEDSAKRQGAAWLATSVLTVLSIIGGWLISWWSK